MVYARQVADQKLTFGVQGSLILNALVMYDRETGSLWSQFLGMAVDGPLKETRLELLPSEITTWGEWKKQHPTSLALDRGFTGPGSDRYMGYYRSSRAGVMGESNPDGRLSTKSLVVGIEGASSQRAYPYGAFGDIGVVNDSFEGASIAIFSNTATGAITMYDRTVGDTTLTFEQEDDSKLVTDRETESIWNKSTGEAVSGSLNPNPPKDTDGRREGSGRGWVRELQGRWPGVLG